MTVSLLISELTRDESFRQFCYDDATGTAVKPGTLVKGHVTVGIGRALDVRGITPDEAKYLLTNDINSFFLGLQQRYVWFNNLDDVRQRVMCNLAFNMGLDGIAKFHEMLEYIADGRYGLAASAMEDSIWFHQVGARAVRLVDAMRTGAMPA